MSKKRAMQLVRGLHNLRPHHRGCVATIGNFDGVHRGHQAILKRLRERARELGVPSCVVIFEPQPREYFTPNSAPARLSRLRDKLELLAAEGIDRVLCLAFNQRLRGLSAAEFVEAILVTGLGVRHLEVGDDFRFGCDRLGDFDFLTEAGRVHGFTLEAARTVEEAGVRVSSTEVRNALAAADFALAARLLGRPFRISGRVLHGQKLARQLGWPTANVQLKRRRAPLTGVYLVSAMIEGRPWPGVANIGVRPSVAGDGRPHLEIHLLDFAGDLYGRRLTVEFHQKLRDEQRFASLEALKSAIDADVAAARAHWQG
jgi:riboflavin kinase/FMN adenylyltransferase